MEVKFVFCSLRNEGTLQSESIPVPELEYATGRAYHIFVLCDFVRYRLDVVSFLIPTHFVGRSSQQIDVKVILMCLPVRLMAAFR